MLRPIDVSDDSIAEFMYRLLLERYECDYINIVGETHGVLFNETPTPPTYEEHLRYIRTGRYEHLYGWFVNEEPIGIVFLTDDSEIGIFILREHQSKSYGGRMLLELMKRHPVQMYARINPKNKQTLEIAKKLGFITTCITMVRPSPLHKSEANQDEFPDSIVEDTD